VTIHTWEIGARLVLGGCDVSLCEVLGVVLGVGRVEVVGMVGEVGAAALSVSVEDVVGEDVVGEDVVGEDVVGEDVVGEDVVGEGVGGKGVVSLGAKPVEGWLADCATRRAFRAGDNIDSNVCAESAGLLASEL
jgi:hypothetical protein